MSEVSIIQQKELEILKQVISICEKNGIEYYALGGTLLGAVRHQGFIPWDDDIDIGMPRKDYERFLNVANEELKYPYSIVSDEHTEGYTKAFAAIRDLSTKIVMTSSNIHSEESIWLDIFPIDGMPSGFLKNKIHSYNYLFSRMMVQLSQFDKIVNQDKIDRPLFERLVIKIANAIHIEKKLKYSTWSKYYKNCITKYDMTAPFAGNYTGAYKLKEIVPSDYFSESTTLEFEGIPLKVPKRYEEYLIAIYGEDYMQLPPEEKRVPHQYEIVTLGD